MRRGGWGLVIPAPDIRTVLYNSSWWLQACTILYYECWSVPDAIKSSYSYATPSVWWATVPHPTRPSLTEERAILLAPSSQPGWLAGQTAWPGQVDNTMKRSSALLGVSFAVFLCIDFVQLYEAGAAFVGFSKDHREGWPRMAADRSH